MTTSINRIMDDEKERCRLLKNQRLLSDRAALKLSKRKDLLETFNKGQELVTQGDDSQHMYFLLTGTVTIIINNNEVKTRKAGTTIGEMGALDSSAPRCATVRASEKVLALKLDYAEFLNILSEDDYAGWHDLTVMLSERLREYTDKVRPQNEVIKVFIGSSSEYFEDAKIIAERLNKAGILAQTWQDDIIKLSSTTLVDLLKHSKEVDFAIFIYSPDDKTVSRDKEYGTPRDNVHFEAGMFMGALGDEHRVRFLIPEGENVKIPSDLDGLIYKKYDRSSPDKMSLMVSQLVSGFQTMGPR